MSDSKDFEENVKRGMEAIRASPSYQKALKEYKESMGNSSPLEDLESKKANATEPENTPAPDTTSEVSPETNDCCLFPPVILSQRMKDFLHRKIPGEGKL